MVESGSSSSDEDAFLSAAEELTSSPTPHNYESPEIGESVEEGGGNGNLYNNNGDVQTVSNVNRAGSETSDEEHVYDNRGAKFLMKLDQNFLESPRLLMAGVWRSKEFELQVKRKETGLNVQWLLTNRQDKRIVLNSIATMTYKSGHPLSIKYDSEPRAFGYAVKGGWAWNGYGYGFVNLNRINRYQENLFPLSDSSIKHIDLEEAVFPEESVQHHICGDTCINIDKNVNIECKEDGCGLEISRLSVQSFSTTVHKPGSWELPHNYKRLHLKEQVSLSLVVFPSSAEYKVLFHMDGKEVAWMRKVEDVSYDHQPIVDHCIMEKHQYIWRTESPGAAIKRSLCISETENEQREAEESYVHQEVAPVSDQDQDGPGRTSTQHAGRSQGSDVGGSSWMNYYEKCAICHRGGFIASHLRNSESCLKQLRARRRFQIGKGSDDQYIVKFALLAGECPSPVCATGQHAVMPEECFDWWIDHGWDILGWKGAKEDADPNLINMKINKFLVNHKSRNQPQDLPESNNDANSQTTAEVGGSQTSNGNIVFCGSCNSGIGDLIEHLNENTECLNEYVNHHLPQELQNEEAEHRLSLFQLSLILGVCGRPQCPTRDDTKYIGIHLSRHVDCLEFYQTKAVNLSLPWSRTSTARIIAKKVAEIKRNLRDTKRREDETGIMSFKKELSRLLKHVCHKCGKMGPIFDDDSSGMTCVGIQEDVRTAWLCGACSPHSLNYEDVKRRLKDKTKNLSKANDDQENLLKVLIHPLSNQTVLALHQIESDFREPQGNVDESWSCEVLVPSGVPSVKAIVHICEEALEQKEELDTYVKEISNRPFVTEIDATLSALYRSKLANIKKTMDKLLFGLSKVARGEILSLNPNLTTATKINPHLGMTVQGALRDNCPWSTAYEEQRSLESAARTNIHGFVKTFLKCTILNGLEDVELQRIFMRAAQAFGPDAETIEDLHPSFILRMAPIVLSYLNCKIKLFIKHIIVRNYANHDLKLQFSRDRWTVDIVGYVYSKGLQQINCEIATNPELILSKEMIKRIGEKQTLLPTVTLNWEELSRQYRIGELRAKKIIATVKRCQQGREASPLSALDMWTGEPMVVTDAEKVLRARAVLLSQQVDDDFDQETQIINIAKKLLDEGLFEDLETETMDKGYIQDIKDKLYSLNPQRPSPSLNALVWYHTLLFKTAKHRTWTLKRKSGETEIVPYHPLLVEATDDYVRMETVMGREYITFEETEGNTPWTEVNILEFLHSVMVKSDLNLVSSGHVNIISSPDLELCFQSSTERDEEVDDIFMNRKNETYIVSNSDMAKLYTKRPEGVEAMTFAEFATEYYIDRWGNHAIIDPETGLGGESEDVIVGGQTFSPIYMQLTNRKVVKRRTRGDKAKPVPILLHTNTLDDYGERILFKPWRSKEELLNEASEEEKSRCKQIRLQLFPMGVFPR